MGAAQCTFVPALKASCVQLCLFLCWRSGPLIAPPFACLGLRPESAEACSVSLWNLFFRSDPMGFNVFRFSKVFTFGPYLIRIEQGAFIARLRVELSRSRI